MIQPVRIQRSRREKQVSPNGLPIVYVGRPGKWGNPFKVEFEHNSFVVKDREGNYWGEIYETREEALNKCLSIYTAWMDGKVGGRELNPLELKNKNLSCWCKVGQQCHADYLLEIANP